MFNVQVTTHSTLGALAYDTGGLFIDNGWLRLLGSGHPRRRRTLPGWNAPRAQGYYLVGDDAAATTSGLRFLLVPQMTEPMSFSKAEAKRRLSEHARY